jgi:hypothetical protein
LKRQRRRYFSLSVLLSASRNVIIPFRFKRVIPVYEVSPVTVVSQKRSHDQTATKTDSDPNPSGTAKPGDHTILPIPYIQQSNHQPSS